MKRLLTDPKVLWISFSLLVFTELSLVVWLRLVGNNVIAHVYLTRIRDHFIYLFVVFSCCCCCSFGLGGMVTLFYVRRNENNFPGFGLLLARDSSLSVLARYTRKEIFCGKFSDQYESDVGAIHSFLDYL